jgi:carbamoyltransferase
VDQSYFDYCTGLRMTNAKFDALFGGPPRKSDQLARPAPYGFCRLDSGGDREEIVLRLTRSIATETGADNLCLAGGFALHCVANGKVLRDGRFNGSGSNR